MPRSGPPAGRERMEHMLEAARDAVFITKGRRREEMETDILLRHALTRCAQVIGEAAARMSDVGRARAPELPWTRIVGMRHILVHDYFRLDHDAIWRVANEHIPQMIPVLQAALFAWPEEEVY